jgi:hypothetical protein
MSNLWSATPKTPKCRLLFNLFSLKRWLTDKQTRSIQYSIQILRQRMHFYHLITDLIIKIKIFLMHNHKKQNDKCQPKFLCEHWNGYKKIPFSNLWIFFYRLMSPFLAMLWITLLATWPSKSDPIFTLFIKLLPSIKRLKL